MKTTLFLIPLLFSGTCLSFLSAAENAAKSISVPTDASPAIPAKQFMEQAAEINLAELSLAKLAKAKGQSEVVKKLADRLLKDHETNSAELTQLAKSKSVTLPGEASQKMREQAQALEKLEGEPFDTNFLTVQEKGHAEAIALYQQAAKSADGEVQAFAAKHLPMLKEHHHMAVGRAASTGGPDSKESSLPTTPGNTGGGTGAPRGGQ